MQREIERSQGWSTRWFVLAAMLAAALPLMWPAVPPLVDLPGHLGSYRIIAEAGTMPIARHYAVAWGWIGNLGVEALVLALHPVLDVEPATHLIVLLIPVLTVAAMLWLAIEVHRRIPPAAGFALPLAYALPFQLGFVNFALAAALALAALALWIRLARRSVPVVRIVAFVPVAGIVWLSHNFGWALLGLMVFGAEWALRRKRGETIWYAAWLAACFCAPMAWPQVLAIVTGSGGPAAAASGGWFEWIPKAQWLVAMLRERWKVYDVACVVVLVLLIWGAIRSKRLSFDPVLGVPTLICLIAYIVLPRFFFGGAYINMRILPYAFALALLAIRTAPGERLLARRLAVAGIAFFALRTLTSIVALALFAREQQAELGAIPLMPVGSSVLTLVAEPSPSAWDNRRLAHIGGIAIARRRVFTNEQWATRGQQLVAPRHSRAAPFDRDPSQLVYPAGADYAGTDFDVAITRFDRAVFGYVWTIGFPAGRAHAADLTLLWRNDRSALYRVVMPRDVRLSSAPSRP